MLGGEEGEIGGRGDSMVDYSATQMSVRIPFVLPPHAGIQGAFLDACRNDGEVL